MRKFLFLLSLFVFVLSLAVGQTEAGKDVEKKMSATLRAQLVAKEDYKKNYNKDLLSPKFKALKSFGLQEVDTQIIFLHFKKKPSKKRLEFLAKLEVNVFDNSWIPPFGKHPTGYLIAKIPLNKIGEVAKKHFIKRMETAEQMFTATNDEAAKSIGADYVSSNLGLSGKNIRIAVLDSGLDTTHGDIPAPIASKDYSNYPSLDDTIENQVTGHGTHVTGSALGRGTLSNGKYRGMAWAADLIFLKIGDDFSSGAPFFSMVGAIKAATDLYNADIISISYGGLVSPADGSDEISQAVDYANGEGVAVCVSAMNEGARQKHFSRNLGGSDETDLIQINVLTDTLLNISLQWFDNFGVSNNLTLKLFDENGDEIPSSPFRDIESPRGTEQEVLFQFVSTGTYFLKVLNTSGNNQDFHIYSNNNWITFENSDPNYTLGTPGVADDAITVTSYTTRISWVNYFGDFYNFFVGTIGNTSSFSSRGPRIDGAQKPSVSAPGEWIASARDKITPLGGPDYLIIDNDGVNNRQGPADYIVLQGTSMSAPIVSGSIALLFQAHPELKGKPEKVKEVLFLSASNGGIWFPDSGWGKINIKETILTIPNPTPTPPEPEPSPIIIPSPEPEPSPTITIPPTPIPTAEPTPIIPPTPEPSPTIEPTPIIPPTPEPEPSPTITAIPTPVPTVEPTPVVPPTPEPKPTCPPKPQPTPDNGGYEPPPKDVFEVQSTDPKNGSVNVETDVVIKITYNQNINGDELFLDRNGSEVELRVEGTETDLPVKLEPQGKNLLIFPISELKPGGSYTLKILRQALKAGNNGGTHMDFDFYMKFTTAGSE